MLHFGRMSQNFAKPLGFCFLNSVYNSFKQTNNNLFCYLIFSSLIFIDTQSFFPGHILLNSSDLNISNTFRFVPSLNTFSVFFSGSASIPLKFLSFLAFFTRYSETSISLQVFEIDQFSGAKVKIFTFFELSSFLICILIILLVDLSQSIWNILILLFQN